MKRKTWTKNQTREHIVGNCKWCQKEIINTEAFVSFASKEHACIKCYRNSGHMLPFWDNKNK